MKPIQTARALKLTAAPIILTLAMSCLGSTIATAQVQAPVIHIEDDFKLEDSSNVQSTQVQVPYAPEQVRSQPQQPNTVVVNGPTVIVAGTPSNVDRFPRFESVLGGCRGVISQLKGARSRAQFEALYGNFGSAAVILKQGLKDAFDNMQQDLPRPYTHTYKAVKAGLFLANRITEIATGRLAQDTADKVIFMSLDKIYDAVSFAYNELDNKFYLNTIHTCYDRGMDCGNFDTIDSGFFSDDYLSGESKLAARFMQIYSSVALRLADDVVELSTAYATTQVAQVLLETSLLRRSFCPVISNLDFIRQQIRYWLNTSNAYNLAEQTQLIRHWMEQIQTQINTASRSNNCGQPDRNNDFRRN